MIEQLINDKTLVSQLLDFLFITLFCFAGALAKDTYDTLTGINLKVKISRILLSTVVSSILVFSLSDFIIEHFTWKIIILPCFACGMIGFEMMGKMTKAIFWFNLLPEKYKSFEKFLEEQKSNDTKDEDDE